MKLKLAINDVPFSGYVNIDPCPKQSPAQCDILIGDPRISVGAAEDNECIEILAPNMMNYLHHTEIVPFLQSWIKKLRHSGRFIIGGIDGFEVAKKYARGEINTIDFNTCLYGPQKTAWGYYLGTITLHELTAILEQLGLKIEKREVTNGRFMIVGVRQ